MTTTVDLAQTTAHDHLVAQIEDLLPAIRARAAEAERQRRVPEETIEELRALNLFRMHVPRRFGGLQLGLRAHFDVFRLLAQADVSTAWTTSFLTIHNYLLARWPERLQLDVFGDQGFALAAASNQAHPGSKGQRDGEGYRITGRWGFCSGISHADWCQVSAPVEDASGGTARLLFTIPKSDLVVHDNWNTSGMRATGSHDVEADGVYVPSHRVMDWNEMASADNPGAALHPDFGFLRRPVHRVVTVIHTAYVLGAAQRALAIFRDEIAPRRKRLWEGSQMIESPVLQVTYAQATLETHVAALLAEDQVNAVEAGAPGAKPLTLEDRALLTLNSVGSIVHAGKAIQLLARASGGSVHRLGSDLDRIQRDIEVLLNHSTGDWNFHAEFAGSALLGQGIGKRPDAFF